MGRTLLLGVADMHANSVVGLFPLRFQIEGDGSPQTILASKTQRATLSAWNQFFDEQEERKEKEAAQCIAVLAGDLLDINTKNPLVLSTANEANVLQLGKKIMEPVLRVADKIFILRGSQTHVGGHGKMEENLAAMLAEKYPNQIVRDEEAGTFSWWWCTLKVNGITIEAAHHSKARAHLPHTMGQLAARESVMVAHRYWSRGRKPPDLVIRAHLHCPGDSSRQCVPHTIFLPGWTGLPDDYVHAKGGSDESRPVGGLWALIQDGDYIYDIEKWWPKEKKPWIGS